MPIFIWLNCISPLLLRFPPVLLASVCFPGRLIRFLPVPWIFLQRPVGLAGKDLQSEESSEEVKRSAHHLAKIFSLWMRWWNPFACITQSYDYTLSSSTDKPWQLVLLLARYLSFPEDDVCIWCRALVDIWFGDDEQDVLWLANGDPSDSCYLPETKLWHCLKEMEVNLPNLIFRRTECL